MSMRTLGLALLAAIELGGAAMPAGTDSAYEGLRTQALTTRAADLGIVPGTAPYGVVMDMDVDGETATLVAFSTGDASLYLSTGGGMIGGGERPKVAEAAKAFVRAADGPARDLEPVTRFPRPGPGKAIIYILTANGVVSGSRPLDTLAGGNDALSPLFYAGNEVLTQLRQVPRQD